MTTDVYKVCLKITNSKDKKTNLLRPCHFLWYLVLYYFALALWLALNKLD